MTHIVTSLCLRDGACIEVCPVECMIPGKQEDGWRWIYIDPDTCIDCGACIPECPFEAIFPEDEVPEAYVAKGWHDHQRRRRHRALRRAHQDRWRWHGDDCQDSQVEGGRYD